MLKKYLDKNLLFFEILFIVFSIHLPPFTGILAPRNLAIALIILRFFWIYKVKGLFDIDIKWIFFAALLFGYIFCISIVNESFSSRHSAFNSYFNFFVMVVILPYLFCKVEQSFDNVVKTIIIATLFQALIVDCSFLFPPFRNFLYKIQNFEENFLFNRIVGLGIAGAKGSIYLFCGYMMNLYWLIFYEYKTRWLFSLFAIFIAITLVGRTGFYLCLVSFILFIYIGTIKDSFSQYFIHIIKNILALIVLSYLISLIVKNIGIDMETFEYTFRRLSELWTHRQTFDALEKMNKPDLSMYLFIGQGWEKGFDLVGNCIWNDSGYIQRFFSLGLIPCIFSYLLLLGRLLFLIHEQNNKMKQLFWFFMVTALFVIEYKEPFIYALSMPFVIIISLMLEIKKDSYEETSIFK